MPQATPGHGGTSDDRAGWRPIALGILALLAVSLALATWLAPPAPREVLIHQGQPAAERAAVTRPTLRVLVSSMTSPRSTLDRYEGLVRLLGSSLDRQGVLLQRRSYADANQALAHGEADLAFICTGAYLHAERAGQPPDVVAVPVARGATTYRAALLVAAGRPARTVADLRGLSVAYVDPLSLTGRQWLRSEVEALGASEASFFSRVVYTGSHDRSITTVARGLADVATVDDLVLVMWLAEGSDLARNVRVVRHSPPFGIPPVVVPPRLDPTLRQQITAALIDLHRTADGRSALAGMGVERFVAPPTDHFDSARALGLR